MRYRITVTGLGEEGFTAAEIDETGGYVGRVYERSSGWHVELRDLDRLRDAELISAVLEAKVALTGYVNRKGIGMPEGLTAAGASLWLMQREDATGRAARPRGSP